MIYLNIVLYLISVYIWAYIVGALHGRGLVEYGRADVGLVLLLIWPIILAFILLIVVPCSYFFERGGARKIP